MNYLITILVLSILYTVNCQDKTPYSLLESYINILTTAAKYQSEWITDTSKFLPNYDFIIIGGGTAGCVLANRLSENPNIDVLLLEAGRDELFIYDVPIMANYFQLTEPNWKHRTIAQYKSCLGFEKNICKLPRGKVLGGSSVLNYMIYTRGHPYDYDTWARMGNYGWSYGEILKYFIKFENIQIKNHNYHRGKHGPVIITHPPYHTKIAESFLKAAQEFGHPIEDYNKNPIAFNYIEANLHNGIRYSSNRAYVMSVRHRKNLHVSKNSFVTKLLINKATKSVYGVEFIKNKKFYHIFNKKEVILSAGSLSSPQILMLSGIGPYEHLKSLNIPVIQNLSVGYNLQDHIAMGGLTFLVDQSVTLITDRILNSREDLKSFFINQTGPLSVAGGVEALGFVNTKLNRDLTYPDIEIFLGAGSLITDPTLRRCIGLKNEIYEAICKPIEGNDSFSLQPMLLRPKSTGRLYLASNDPFKLPLIDTNYLSHEHDINVLLEGAKIALNLIENSQEFKQYNARINTLQIPDCKQFIFGSDEYWKCAMKQLTLNIYHQCGTCKMGVDDEAVVDPELRVYGVKNLRVIDASIMPKIPSGHTNGPVLMIAEKGADMIKTFWHL